MTKTDEGLKEFAKERGINLGSEYISIHTADMRYDDITLDGEFSIVELECILNYLKSE